MPRTDVEKLEESYEKFSNGIEMAKSASSGDAGARMLEIVSLGALATAAYQIAIQMAKLNEFLREIREEERR